MPNDRDRICVLVEQEKGQALPVAFELLNAGRKLADSGGEMLCACILGQGIADLSDEIAFYADEVYAVDSPLLADFQADLHTSALESVCRAVRPVSMLMGHTYDNSELAPKIGSRMGSEVVTDCTGIERDGVTGDLLCAKAVYGGNAAAVFELSNRPQIVTLRPKVYDPLPKRQSQGKKIPFHCDLDPSLARVRSMEAFPGQSVSLDKAEVIVAGGRGVKTPEGISELERLIGVLRKYFDKVELGASRPLVDEGLLSRSHQVGQTGEKVSPQLYIAIAISGATQHVTGIVGSRKIIAINKDREAPIFDVADYGVVGPFEEVIPALIERLEELS